MSQSLPVPIDLAGVLVSYAIYSSAALLAVLFVTRWQSIMTSDLRCLLWKWALLVPLPLVVLSTLLPSPAWVRQINLRVSPGVHEIALARSLDKRVDRELWLAAHRGEQDTNSARSAGRTSTHQIGSPSAGAGVTGLIGTSGLARRMFHAHAFWPMLVLVSLAGAAWGLLRVLVDASRIGRLKSRSQRISNGPIVNRLQRLQRRAGLRRPVELFVSAEIDSPMTAGLWRPFIMIPSRLLERLSTQGQEAVLAHELAHVAHRDALWNILSLLVCRICFIQPLNVLARRRLRIESEYLADRWAAEMLEDRVQLARCLADLGDWLLQCGAAARRSQPLAVGMGSFRSGLGSRVAALLDDAPRSLSGTRWQRQIVTTLLLVLPLAMLSLAPRASAQHSQLPLSDTQKLNTGNQTMKPIVSNVGILVGLAMAPVVDAQTDAPSSAAKNEAVASSAFPEQLENFNGMLIGKMVSRDVERGEFTVTVDYVARIWENNKAKQPRSAVGKTLVVDGVTGKWLDSLLLIRPGDTVEFEAQHRSGDRLTFPGEWLRKVPAFNPADHPTPPDGFRGFAGIVVGKIESKQEESGELVIRVNQIEKSFEKSAAKNAESAIDKPIVLVGFWGKMRQPFDQLKVGQSVRAGVMHRVPQSDHFSVTEVFEKMASPERDASPSRDDQTSEFPSGMRGFRGILRGVVVRHDVERGELVFRAEEATRLWKQNQASDAQSSQGRVFTVEGISGKFLDVLLTLQPGDRIDVEAFHNRGEHLDFVGELLRKVE